MKNTVYIVKYWNFENEVNVAFAGFAFDDERNGLRLL